METVHALVAEVFRKFKDPVIAPYNSALEIELVGNAEV
jgi:hypothetical protein